MLAVLGAETQTVEESVQALKGLGLVQIANYNCPGQVVISLERRWLRLAKSELGSIAKKVVELPVSGAFHSPLMAEAKEGFSKFLTGIPLRESQIPILLNATLTPSLDSVEIKEALVKQITNPVRWQQVVTQMISWGVNTFVEVGPKDVLAQLVKRIARDCHVVVTNGRNPQEIIDRLGVRGGEDGA